MSDIQFVGYRPISDLTRQDIEQGNIGEIKTRTIDPETHILTITTDKGSFDFYAPKLDDPKAVSANDMKSAMNKMSGLTDDSSQVLSDVFQLMGLLFETMKSLRTAAREGRNAERAQQVLEIDNQVNKLKTAAATAMAMGFATAAITLGMAGYSAAKLGDGMKQQFNVNKAEQFQMAKAKLDGANTKVDNLQAEYNKANTQLTSASQKVDTLTADLAKAQDVASGKVVLKPSDMKGKTMEDFDVNKLTKELDAAKLQKAELTTKVDTLSEQLTKAKSVQTEAQNNFESVSKTMDEKSWKLWADEEQSGGKLKEAEHNAQNQIKKVDYLNQATQGISQGMGGLGQGVQGLIQAEATAHEGEARQAEFRAQEQSEWMQEMREAINKVMELKQAILQSQKEASQSAMKV